MRRMFFFWIVLLASQVPAFATWSVIAVDRSTGRVVIASATCVNNDDEFLKGVQAVVVPGKGVAACQRHPRVSRLLKPKTSRRTTSS